MKYIKTFDPQIDDFCIAYDTVYDELKSKSYCDQMEYCKNNVGQIIKIKNDVYIIYYNNVPIDLGFTNGFTYFTIVSIGKNIYFYSKSKEECEIFLTGKKYNI
jgi:hypothetical protein